MEVFFMYDFSNLISIAPEHRLRAIRFTSGQTDVEDCIKLDFQTYFQKRLKKETV
jgi:hypothetical protein